MLGKKHLHIDQDDFIIDTLVRSMASAVGGTIKVDIGNEPAMRIDIDRDNRSRCVVNKLLEVTLFSEVTG
jgi:hypothetical protein